MTWSRFRSSRFGIWLIPSLIFASVVLAIACQPAADPPAATPDAAATQAPATTPDSGDSSDSENDEGDEDASAGDASAEPQGSIVASLNPNTTVAYSLTEVTSAGQGAQFFWPVYDGLTWVDRQGIVQPGLAESWDSEDGVTWTFTLRDDVTFQNGSAFTAEDVVGSFELFSDPTVAPRNASVYANVESVDAVDDQTVEIVLRSAQASFPQVIALGLIFDASERTLEEENADPNGTGPYRFVSFQSQTETSYEAMPADFVSPRGPAGVAELQLVVIPEQSTLSAALQTGDIAIGYPFTSPELIDQLEGEGFNVWTGTGSGAPHFNLDMSQPPFDDIRVREAVNMAVDQQAITDAVLGGYATPEHQLSGPDVLAYDPEIEGIPYDPEGARELLAEAGYPDGFEIDMTYMVALNSNAAEAIAAQLAEVGIQVNLDMQDSAVWREGFYGAESDRPGFFYSPINYEQTFEPDSVWRWWSTDIPEGEGRRGMGEGFAEFDALYQEAKATLDRDEREAAYAAAGEQLNSLIPVLYLWNTVIVSVTDAEVEWQPGLFADQWTTNIVMLDE